jgi:flagellar basal body L-ring protein FlgH
MKKLLLTSIIAVAFLSGCAMTSPSASNDVDSAIANAQMKYEKAHSEMVAWGKTKSLIKKAKKLAKTDPKKAIALANEAAYQADTALAQSEEFEKTWQAAVPK